MPLPSQESFRKILADLDQDESNAFAQALLSNAQLQTNINHALFDGPGAALSPELSSFFRTHTIRFFGGRNALLYAAAYGTQEMIELCLACGASPAICDDQDKTPLIIAAEYDNLDAVRYLTDLGPGG